MAGAGVASTTASAPTVWPADETVHPSPARSSRSAGAESRTSTPRSPQARPERLHQGRHAALERPEEWRPVGVRCGDLGPERPHETAAALGRRQQRREGRRGGHVVDRTGVDAADQGVDEDVDDLLAQLARHERADGAVADRPPDVGAGQHGVAGQADQRLAHRGHRCERSARTGWGCPARAPRGVPRRRPRAHTDAPRAPIGTSASASPTSRHSSIASGRRPRKPSGPMSTARPPNDVAAQRAAEARRRLEQRPPSGASRRCSAPPVSSQAAARPLMPPPTTTTRRGVTSRCAVRGDDHVGEHGDEGRVVVERRGPDVGEAARRGDGRQLDVEVVEHLEVVGHETDRADDDGVGAPSPARRRTTSRTSGPSQGSGVRPRSARPRSTRRGPPPRPPAGPTRRAARGRCRPSRRIRSGRECAVKITSGATRRRARARPGRGRRAGRRTRARRTREAPPRTASLRSARRGPVEVLLGAQGRSVRREDEADDPLEARRRPARRAASSMRGSVCLAPNATTKRPGARRSSAARTASTCAAVRSASGETPPMAR